MVYNDKKYLKTTERIYIQMKIKTLTSINQYSVNFSSETDADHTHTN